VVLQVALLVVELEQLQQQSTLWQALLELVIIKVELIILLAVVAVEVILLVMVVMVVVVEPLLALLTLVVAVGHIMVLALDTLVVQV
jgi:hypothetical protein